MRFVIYQDRKKEWRWRLVARNGNTVADCAEGYRRKARVQQMIGKILDLTRRETKVVE